MSEVLLLLSAPLIGIIIGLMPSVGMLVTMTLLYPVLNSFEPLFLILFYAIASNARDFSGSVSALNFGIMGEITSTPALKERLILIENGQQLSALRNTMLGSMVGVILALVFLVLSLWSLSTYTFLLRTDFLLIFILATMLILLTWKNKNIKINLLLLIAGFFIGKIGFNYISHTEFLTFGNVYLASGLPTLPFLLGIYAVPKMLEVIQIKQINSSKITNNSGIRKFQWKDSFLGSAIGGVCGLVPFVGTTISSNVAHSICSFFKKTNSVDDSLGRLTSAESSNNASQITALIPLLALGIAVQPSELVLLDLIESKGWSSAERVDWDMIVWLIVGVLVGCIVASLLCYNFVKPLVVHFSNHIKKIVYTILFVLIGNVIYIGSNMDQSLYFLTVFFVCCVIGIFLHKRKIDCVPMLLAFMLSNELQDAIYRIVLLYFV